VVSEPQSASEPRIPPWVASAAIAIAIAGLVVLSFAERWHTLNESAFPVGVDGYFYPIQLRSLVETHTLAYPAAPLAFWLMWPIAAVTDPITGAKLGAALFGALVAVPAYGVGARLGQSRGAGLVAAALAAMSAGSHFLTIEFVKNGVGLTVLLTALWLLLRALDRPTTARLALAVLGGVLAILAHKMAAALLVVFAVPAILAAAAGRGVLRGRRMLITLALVGGVTALLFVLGMVFPKRLPSPGDIDLAKALFASEPRFDGPALVTPSVTLTFGYEAVIGAILGAMAAFTLTRVGRASIDSVVPGVGERAPLPAADMAVAWTVAILAIAIWWPWFDVGDVQGLGFRLRVAAFVPMALAGAIVCGRVLARVRHRDFILAAVALAIAARTPGHRDEGRIVAHPAMVAAIHALENEVPASDTIIVPERHIAFMVAWYTRAHVRIRPEEIPAEHRWRLMPLAWIGMGSPLDEALEKARDQPDLHPPLGLHPRHPNGIVLVPEATWRWVLDTLPPEARGHWARWRTI